MKKIRFLILSALLIFTVAFTGRVVAQEKSKEEIEREMRIKEEFDAQKKAIAKQKIDQEEFLKEMQTLRFGLKPSAVYFNPTDRCNFNCTYCYIPEKMRKHGANMSAEKLIEGLSILKRYFKTTVPKGRNPQIIFHGAEPLTSK